MTYIPHKTCLADPTLIWLMFVFDLLVMAAYFAIPCALMVIYAARPRTQRWTYSIRSSILILFAAFIFLCGTSHLFEAITLFFPWYWAEAVVKGLTAAVSIATTAVMFKRKEKLVAFPATIEKDYRKLQELEHKISLLIEQHP